jgi:hypothetical protein
MFGIFLIASRRVAQHGDGELSSGRSGDGNGGHRTTERQSEFAAQATDVLAENRRAATTAAGNQFAKKLRRRRTVSFETFP